MLIVLLGAGNGIEKWVSVMFGNAGKNCRFISGPGKPVCPIKDYKKDDL